MRQKQLLFILGIAVVLLGMALGIQRWRSGALESAGAPAGGKVLPDFPLNDIAKIVVAGASNKVTVVRKDGTWGVEDRWAYPADFERVSEVLRSIWDLKSVQGVLAGPSQLGRLELEAPGEGEGKGTLVEFWKEGAKEPIKLLIGKRPGNGSGRFVKAAGSDNVWLVSDSFYRLTPAPLDWIKRDLPDVGAAKSIVVRGADGKEVWALSREKDTDELKLQNAAPGEEFDDATHGYTAKNPMSYATFFDLVAPETKADSVGLDKPRVAEIKTFDGFTYTLKIGHRDPQNRSFVRIAVTAAIPEKREPGKDEKEEDKKRLDEEFKKKHDELKKKLADAKAMERWTYLLEESRVSFFMKDRPDVLKKKEEKKDEEKKEGAGKEAPASEMAPETAPGEAKAAEKKD
ncbi:MAG: DUF4340 domain-containing protein [Verrucomicrobiae bacterium]|nr:DUF4340 domain-containing protein [Verrucomicrobiae bacterium]